MERIATELALRLADALESFARGTQRLFHVHCDPRTAKLAETMTTAVLERRSLRGIHLRAPATGTPNEWGVRAIELSCWYASEARGEALPRALFARPDAATFAAVLGAVVARLSGPSVIVIAPRPAPRALDAATLLALARALPDAVRLVCIEHAEPARVLTSASEVRTLELRLDDDQVRVALAERFEAMAAAPALAEGARSTGGAGPRVAPPPRPSAIAPTRERVEAQQRAGSARRAIAAFAAAAVRGNARAMLATHDEASAALASLGAETARAHLRVARAQALAACGELEEALRECTRMAAQARVSEDAPSECAALSCAAGLLLGAGQRERARGVYGELATLADSTGERLLALHALRTRADLALRDGAVAEAASALDRAMAVADQAVPLEVIAGPFSAVVAELARLCRAHGLEARAAETERRGEEIMAAAFRAIGSDSC